GATQVMSQVPASVPPPVGVTPEAAAAPLAPMAPQAPAAPAPAAATPDGYPLGGGIGAGGTGSSGSTSDRVKDFEREIERQVAAGPASEGLIDQFKFYVASGLNIYKEHYMNGIMTVGLVMVPATLLSALFSFIP